MMILVGTDYSPGAAAAWREARRLADGLGAEVVLVHVVDAGESTTEAMAAVWCSEVGADPARVWVRRGLPWVELSRCADELGADLIVVGSHGHTGYQPLALGSTPARLGLCATPPLLVVPDRRRAPWPTTPFETREMR